MPQIFLALRMRLFKEMVIHALKTWFESEVSPSLEKRESSDQESFRIQRELLRSTHATFSRGSPRTMQWSNYHNPPFANRLPHIETLMTQARLIVENCLVTLYGVSAQMSENRYLWKWVDLRRAAAIDCVIQPKRSMKKTWSQRRNIQHGYGQIRGLQAGPVVLQASQHLNQFHLWIFALLRTHPGESRNVHLLRKICTNS